MRPQHDAIVAVLGSEYVDGREPPEADALITTVPGLALATLAADCEIVVIALAVKMHGEGEVLRRSELVQAALELEGVGAHVDVLFARNKAVDDVDNLRMEQRFAAGDGDHGRTAFFRGGKALLRSELLAPLILGFCSFLVHGWLGDGIGA